METDIDLSGEWDVTYEEGRGERKASLLTLVQNGNCIMGRDEGGGRAYHVEGVVVGGKTLKARYMALAATAQNDSSNGELILTLQDGGKSLRGSYIYYSGNAPYTLSYVAIYRGPCRF